jgi:ribosome-associated protein
LPFGDYAAPPTVSIDTKENMDEIAGNICGSEHKRFIAECKAAKAAGCQLVILVENTVGIRDISEVHEWLNPRAVYSDKCVQGPRLQKAMETISERYGVRFMFCRPEEAAERITEIIRNDGLPDSGD